MEHDKPTKQAIIMIAKDGEHMAIYGNCDCSGKVNIYSRENLIRKIKMISSFWKSIKVESSTRLLKVEIWLNNVTDAMKRSVRYHISQAVFTYDEKPREQWIFDHQAQPALCGSQIWWTTEVNMAFARLEEGFENAFKDYQRKQINQLNALITILCGDLIESDRRKIMTICTIDVHARDVVGKMITMKAESSSSFQWQSQLRHRCKISIICPYSSNFNLKFQLSDGTTKLAIVSLIFVMLHSNMITNIWAMFHDWW